MNRMEGLWRGPEQLMGAIKDLGPILPSFASSELHFQPEACVHVSAVKPYMLGRICLAAMDRRA